MNLLSTVSAPTEQATRVRYAMLGWFCSLSMITYIDRVCIMQVQDEMKYDLGLNAQQFSFVFSAFALAYAMFEVPSGWLGDRIGPRKVLSRIVLCWLLFTALTGLVPTTTAMVLGLPLSLVLLIAIRFLFGAGEAGAYPNIARATRNWFPFSERGRAQGLIWTFGRWGGGLAPVLVFALAYPFMHFEIIAGWRGAFLMLGLLGIFWVIGFARYYRDTPDQHPGVNAAERARIVTGAGSGDKPAAMSWTSILTSPTLWMLSIMYFCSNSGWSFFITYVKPYLQTEWQLEGVTLALAAGAPLFLGGFGCLLGGLLTDFAVRRLGRRWGRTLQGLCAYFLGASFFLIAALLPPSAGMLAFGLICLASFVKDFAMAASWSTTIDIGHRYSGTVAGLMNTVGNLGTVFSPPLVMWLEELTGSGDTKLYFYSTMFFIASFCWLFINPMRVIVYAPADHGRLQEEGVLPHEV